ncbi:hypothetical protein [Corallococcus sp. CA053C]|uniref:hypothetical protein n=1 Tax=Corallococcus sp. CA053C TaxID=2316732 RepID=UPI0011C3B874|nr:hypothetical protein [Corallococcus sp. CA053C]
MSITGVSDRIVIETSVDVDVMYYWMAMRALKRAKRVRKTIDSVESEWRLAEAREEAVLRRYGGDEAAAYDELEADAIHMVDGLHPELESKYGHYAECISLIYVFGATALEAHINSRAMELSRSWFDSFDKLPLDGKWLFFPKVKGLKGFEPGEETYGRFLKLIAMRNRLVHFKVNTTELWKAGRVPSFVMAKDFSVDSAEKALGAARSMICMLAGQMSEKNPDWVDTRPSSYFGFRHVSVK